MELLKRYAFSLPSLINGPNYQKKKKIVFKPKQESARKGIERAFEVIQGRWHIIDQPTSSWGMNMILDDQDFVIIDVKDIYICPQQNLQRLWVERCETPRRKSKELCDKQTHTKLQRNIIEHCWQ
ncbi:hypothetical protein OROGR_024923 [Orobanche gracilis]